MSHYIIRNRDGLRGDFTPLTRSQAHYKLEALGVRGIADTLFRADDQGTVRLSSGITIISK